MRRVLERRPVELGEELLGAIEEAGAVKVLRELEFGGASLVRGQVRAIEKVLVHPDRAVDFALPAKEAAQREMQIDGLRIDLDHLDERLDRLVRLLVQQEIEAAKIGQRQRARLAQQMPDVDARGDPAEREEHDRDRQQPPELEFHGCRARVASASAAYAQAPLRAFRRVPPGRASARVFSARVRRLTCRFSFECAQRAGEESRGDADRERDQHDEHERRLPAPHTGRT